MTEISGIAKEIEHKYLLSKIPEEIAFLPGTKESYLIRHGWIPGEVIQERITWSKGQGWRVIKSGRGLERIEAQEKISRALYEALDKLCDGKRVSKIRYVIEDETGKWELDSFCDRVLYLAEIEVPSVDTKVVIPSWLEPVVVREVTEESEFVNVNLAR